MQSLRACTNSFGMTRDCRCPALGRGFLNSQTFSSTCAVPGRTPHTELCAACARPVLSRAMATPCRGRASAHVSIPSCLTILFDDCTESQHGPLIQSESESESPAPYRPCASHPHPPVVGDEPRHVWSKLPHATEHACVPGCCILVNLNLSPRTARVSRVLHTFALVSCGPETCENAAELRQRVGGDGVGIC